MAIDTQASTSQTARLLHHARPQILIWASQDNAGGAGPINPAGLPDGCHPMLMPNPYMPTHNAAIDKRPTRHTSNQSDRDKQVQQQLPKLVAEWQKLTADKPKLPFCYVMYTSGSTGSPAGVCGTETGQYPCRSCSSPCWKDDLAHVVCPASAWLSQHGILMKSVCHE